MRARGQGFLARGRARDEGDETEQHRTAPALLNP